MTVLLSRRSFLLTGASFLIAPHVCAQTDEAFLRSNSRLRRHVARELLVNPAALASTKSNGLHHYQKRALVVAAPSGHRRSRQWAVRTADKGIRIGIGHHPQRFALGTRSGITHDPYFQNTRDQARRHFAPLETAFQERPESLTVDGGFPILSEDDYALQNIGVLAADQFVTCGCIAKALNILDYTAGIFSEDDGMAASEYAALIRSLSANVDQLGYVEVRSNSEQNRIWFNEEEMAPDSHAPCGFVVVPGRHSFNAANTAGGSRLEEPLTFDVQPGGTAQIDLNLGPNGMNVTVTSTSESASEILVHKGTFS